MEYGQFCPIAKSSEIIGEKWTILIIRELLMGSTQFNQLQKGLTLMSPSLLSKRLDKLEYYGLIFKKKKIGLKGYEYFPTPSCKELLPIILALGEWGMVWAKKNICEKDYDVNLLMLYLERSISPDMLPGKQTVIKFKFTDIEKNSDWWILVTNGNKDLCNKDPGHEVDIYINTNVQSMTKIWMGDLPYKKALREKYISIIGPEYLVHSISDWMPNSMFADLPSAKNI